MPIIDPKTGKIDLTIPDEDQVAAIMQYAAVDEMMARFILAIEKGEIDGDIIVEGKEPTQ